MPIKLVLQVKSPWLSLSMLDFNLEHLPLHFFKIFKFVFQAWKFQLYNLHTDSLNFLSLFFFILWKFYLCHLQYNSFKLSEYLSFSMKGFCQSSLTNVFFFELALSFYIFTCSKKLGNICHLIFKSK